MSVLVAGIGNIFLGDDGFGVEVVRRLDPTGLPADVEVADYGIRGVHLAYELLDGRYDTLVLVDAVPLGEPAGTVAVLDATAAGAGMAAGTLDAHSMSPDVVLRALRGLGGSLERVLVVGCQPADVEERMGLSPAVDAAVDEAVGIVADLARSESSRAVGPVPRREGAAACTRSSC